MSSFDGIIPQSLPQLLHMEWTELDTDRSRPM